MPAARPLMSPQAEADLHDIATCLKMLVAQSLASPGIPFWESMSRLFKEGEYEGAKAGIDAGPDRLRAVA